MNRLLPIVCAFLLASCTFDPDLGDNYFTCKPGGTCPEGCVCLEGQICIPLEGYDINDCAWCSDGYEACYNPEKPDVKAVCVDTKFDPAHCGECNKPCLLSNAISDCIEGTCLIIECLDCYEDCDQLDHTGCESCTETDPNNCGECGVVCNDPPPAYCDGDNLVIYLDTGDCVDSQCEYPPSPRLCEFGCENGACKNDPCLQVTCNLNQHCEDGGCVCDDLWGDCDTNNLNGCETYLSTLENCGECEFSCGENGICVDGVCDCQFGFGNCNDSWGDGCEEDVLHNNTHCSVCGNGCSFPTDTCCAGICVDTNTDRGNCGRCNLFCSGLTECCLGNCTETQLDPENCGSCGNTCQAPTSTCCWGSCLNAMEDAGNCGECGNDCAMNQPCHQGACGIQGIHCGDADCNFWMEECCYGASGIACYPEGSCGVRVVQCDDDSDCGDSLYCCLVDTPEHITLCTGTCLDVVCSSDAYCLDTDPGTPHCCAADYYGQTVNTCRAEFCQ